MDKGSGSEAFCVIYDEVIYDMFLSAVDEAEVDTEELTEQDLYPHMDNLSEDIREALKTIQEDYVNDSLISKTTQS